jgi:hypothetical protein
LALSGTLALTSTLSLPLSGALTLTDALPLPGALTLSLLLQEALGLATLTAFRAAIAPRKSALPNCGIVSRQQVALLPITLLHQRLVLHHCECAASALGMRELCTIGQLYGPDNHGSDHD